MRVTVSIFEWQTKQICENEKVSKTTENKIYAIA